MHDGTPSVGPDPTPDDGAADVRLADARAADARVERNRLVYQALPASVTASLVVAAILAFVQSAVIAPSLTVGWFVGLSLVNLGRLFVALSYRPEAELPWASRRHQWRFTAGAVAAGAAWGAGGILLFPGDVVHQVFLGFVMAGVSAGAVSSLSPSPRTMQAFLALALLPLAGRLLATGGEIPVAMGLTTVLFLAFLAGSGRRIGRMIRDNIQLRLEEERRKDQIRETAEVLGTNVRALQRLHAVTARADTPLDEKVQEILAIGVDTFRLDVGIVSLIHGSDYIVDYVAGAGETPAPGTRFPLEETFCTEVVTADGPVAFQHVGGGPLARHPAYRRFRLEAYIGTPVFVGGERHGTLNFSSSEPRRAPFTEVDLALIRILAEWIGHEIDRLRTVSRLQESEERNRLILQSVGEGIYGLDRAGRTSFVNPSAVRILGFEPDELLGRSMHDLVHHTRPDGSPYPIAECPTTATFQQGEARTVGDEVLWTRDGQPVPVEYTSTPVWKGDRLVGAVVSFRDVTEQKRYERRLRSTLAMQRAILDAANYSIIATDLAGVISTFNQGAERMLGYTEEEMVGRHTPELIHDPDEVVARARQLTEELGRPVEPGFDAFVALARERGIADERRWTYLRKDGSRLPVLLSVTAVRDDAGTLIGYLGVAADLTEQEKVDRLKKEFVATVSHELRTPLTSIRGSLGLVAAGAAGPLPDRAADLVRVAARNSERLILLINDILDMEKIESGKLDFTFETLPVRELVEQAIEANRAFARDRGTDIRLAGSPPDTLVQVDPNRLDQALANLLSNAAKFSPPDRAVEVEVEDVGGAVRVHVTDHGPGIPEEFRTRIFEKFTQADASDHRKRGGTGLGLSITRALVERMGGRVWFETETGVGTTFTIQLPAREPEDAPPERPDDGGLPAVLHVEPDPDLRTTVAALGADVASFHPAPSVAAALDALDRDRYDLVLLESVLPDGSGWDVLARLETEPTPPAVVVFSTSTARPPAGATVAAELLKSRTSDEELVRTLRSVLDHGAGAAGATRDTRGKGP